MKVELRKWCLADKKELIELFNAVDRTYLSDRLPSPYTEDDANWWLNMFTKEWFYTRRSHAQSGD